VRRILGSQQAELPRVKLSHGGALWFHFLAIAMLSQESATDCVHDVDCHWCSNRLFCSTMFARQTKESIRSVVH